MRIHPLKLEIINAGITQLEVAFTLGINETLLSKYLNGWRPIPANTEKEIKTAIKNLRVRRVSR